MPLKRRDPTGASQTNKHFMKKSYLPVCLLGLLFSCTQAHRQHENSAPPTDTASVALRKDTLPVPRTPVTTPQNVQQDSVIYLAFLPDSNSLTARGRLDANHAPVICYLPVTTGRQLTASILPAKEPANIRFNQLFLPDGSSDGPFGQKLEYQLPQKGMYKLYIAPSLMANDAYTGDFLLRVRVE